MNLIKIIKTSLKLIPKESVDKATEQVGESLKNRRMTKTIFKALVVVVIALLLAYGFIPKDMFEKFLDELI